MLNITNTNISELLDPNCGATVLRPSEIQYLSLIPWVPLITKFKTPPQSELISNYLFVCLGDSPDTVWKHYASMLAKSLNAELIPHLPISEAIQFDDLYLTHYPQSPCGVGPHRDTNCKGLVLAYIIAGTLPFVICEDKTGKNPIRFTIKAGEILLMRADKVGDLARPVHFIDTVEEPVLQFGLRQYINPNK